MRANVSFCALFATALFAVAGDAMARALGVARVEFAFICCSPDGKVEAYVGVEPRGSKAPVYNAPPAADLKLPADLEPRDVFPWNRTVDSDAFGRKNSRKKNGRGERI